MISVLKVFIFYAALLSERPLSVTVVVFFGFCVRILSISTFVLTLKVFLEIIRPDSTLSNTLFYSSDFLGRDAGEFILKLGENYALVLISILMFLFVVQFITSRLYVLFSNNLIANLVREQFVKYKKISNSEGLEFALDALPTGTEASIKTMEIMCFYLILIFFIYMISPTIFVAILLAVPSMLILLIFLNKKDITYITKRRTLRRRVMFDLGLLDDYISTKSYQKTISSNNVINSRFLGGVAITFMMFSYIVSTPYHALDGLNAIVLVFSIRFVVIYAGELSRQINRLTRQRNLIQSLSDFA